MGVPGCLAAFAVSGHDSRAKQTEVGIFLEFLFCFVVVLFFWFVRLFVCCVFVCLLLFLCGVLINRI